MTGQNEDATKFEIKLENGFFYQTVLPSLVSRELNYSTQPSVNHVILTSISDASGPSHTLSDVNAELKHLLRGLWVPRYVYGDPSAFISRLRGRGAEPRELVKKMPKSARLYEYSDAVLLEYGPEGAVERARGALPYMAYYCAVDGFVVTHVSRAFFSDPDTAADALAVFSSGTGFGGLYVCIHDGQDGEEAADGQESG